MCVVGAHCTKNLSPNLRILFERIKYFLKKSIFPFYMIISLSAFLIAALIRGDISFSLHALVRNGCARSSSDVPRFFGSV